MCVTPNEPSLRMNAHARVIVHTQRVSASCDQRWFRRRGDRRIVRFTGDGTTETAPDGEKEQEPTRAGRQIIEQTNEQAEQADQQEHQLNDKQTIKS